MRLVHSICDAVMEEVVVLMVVEVVMEVVLMGEGNTVGSGISVSGSGRDSHIEIIAMKGRH